MRTVIGGVLIAFALYHWFRPNSAAANAGVVADGAVGVVNGVVGRCDESCRPRHYSVVQSSRLAAGRAARRVSADGVATFVMIALWLGGTGKIGTDTAWLFLIGLPSRRSWDPASVGPPRRSLT